MNRILILFAHPALHKSRVNRVMIDQIKDTKGITLHKLYDEYPDYHINVKREQQLLLEHDIIIWHHPFYWYSSPAIIKEWIDLVLEHNFAYGRNGRALEGKKVMSVITTGGQKQAYSSLGYNKFPIRTLLSPFEQTAKLCRMEYYPPFVVHGTHILKDSEINKYAQRYKEVLISLSEELFDPQTITNLEYTNELIP